MMPGLVSEQASGQPSLMEVLYPEVMEEKPGGCRVFLVRKKDFLPYFFFIICLRQS